MRLIDADALAKELMHEGLGYQYNRVINAPTVDAVPVIRCKDCVKYKIFNDSYCPWIEQEVEEDFFCADGKRREE